MRIVVNGELRELDGVASPAMLDAVIAGLGLVGDRVAVERNGQITPRAGWPQIEIGEGDRLEIVHFVGGGA